MKASSHIYSLLGFSKTWKTSVLVLLITLPIINSTALSLAPIARKSQAVSLADLSGVSPTYVWHTFYGPSSSAHGIAIDGNGNIYISSSGDATWLGDNNTPPLHPYKGGYDLLVTKLDRNGVYQWHTFYGSDALDYGAGIVVDDESNLYITGRSEGAWLGDNDTVPLHPFGGSGTTASDIFVVKLNANGAYQWHTFYGMSDYSDDICLDERGNLYVLGSSASGWLGDAGATPLHPHTGMWDFVVLGLTRQGTYLWHTFYGGTDSLDFGEGIVADKANNLYIVGSSSAAWQNGTLAPLHPHSGNSDLYVVKLDSVGTCQWHTFYGSSDTDNPGGIALDAINNIYVLGTSFSSWQGDQEAAPIHPHSGFWNFVAMKLDHAGAYQWHTFYGYNEGSDGAVSTDRIGNVYFTSLSQTPWEGDHGMLPLHPFSGSRDIVIVKLNSVGSYQWHSFYGSANQDYGEAIALDGKEGLYIAGGSQATWQGDGNSAPLHPYAGIQSLTLLKLERNEKELYLPLIMR